MSRLNIPTSAELIARNFGLKAAQTFAFKVGMPLSTEKDSSLNNPNLPAYKSYLGTQVMSDLNISVKLDSGLGLQIYCETVLFTVYQKKNIIVTPIQGRNGTVKEYVSDGDYHINVKGVITGYNGVYPDDTSTVQTTIKDLLSILKSNKSLNVYSWYLIQFGINKMVVTDYKLHQNEGEYSMQPFELNAISDTPFEINVSK